MARVAINGLGRIGRATLKIVMDTPGLDLVAANDIGTSANVEYLLKYDFVPTSTGAAAATAKALPEYRGRFDGVAVRAPVAVGSLADIVAVAARPTTVDEVNHVFTEEARSERYRGVLGVTSDPVVSSDIIKDPRASVVDLGMTVDGDLVKVMSWYDNEWGYSSQLVREALRIARETDLKAHEGAMILDRVPYAIKCADCEKEICWR